MIAAWELGVCCGGDLHDRQVGRLSLLQRDLGKFWVVPHIPKVEIVNHSYIKS